MRAIILSSAALIGLALPALAQDARPARGTRPDVTREVFMQRAEARAARRFARIDTDGSGTLSRDERAADRERSRAAWQARQAARAARGAEVR